MKYPFTSTVLPEEYIFDTLRWIVILSYHFVLFDTVSVPNKCPVLLLNTRTCKSKGLGTSSRSSGLSVLQDYFGFPEEKKYRYPLRMYSFCPMSHFKNLIFFFCRKIFDILNTCTSSHPPPHISARGQALPIPRHKSLKNQGLGSSAAPSLICVKPKYNPLTSQAPVKNGTTKKTRHQVSSSQQALNLPQHIFPLPHLILPQNPIPTQPKRNPVSVPPHIQW